MEHDIKTSTILKIRNSLKSIDPDELSKNTGAFLNTTEDGTLEFKLSFFDEGITVDYTDYRVRDSNGEDVKQNLQSLILYYFVTADGTKNESRWVALSELPDGGFYNQAYQGYSGNRLVKNFKNDIEALRSAAHSLGGTAESYGDLGFSFRALPKVPLLATYWKGDEEFFPSAKILFDKSACHYLPTDLCAFLGSVLTERLIEAK